LRRSSSFSRGVAVEKRIVIEGERELRGNQNLPYLRNRGYDHLLREKDQRWMLKGHPSACSPFAEGGPETSKRGRQHILSDKEIEKLKKDGILTPFLA